MKDVAGLLGQFGDKPIFLKLLRRVWHKHPQFNEASTLLVDDTRYKSLKNDYESCSYIQTYEPNYYDPNKPKYLMDVVLQWITRWLDEKFPTSYSRHTPLFDVEANISLYVADYFVSLEGYSYRFDPPYV
ncbi:hypothetical protein GOP47_0015954 [Adiantum capillus-veneris]|uniref:FCP1 homology domain-containing protein n=1 Tax=Adiantum capillus-veneris TaxID=13818 RepID=A0A9D4ZBP4_ADICA|nr:hypothetical protein GOP47_0015954 [Adiantum capillus-veneris]